MLGLMQLVAESLTACTADRIGSHDGGKIKFIFVESCVVSRETVKLVEWLPS